MHGTDPLVADTDHDGMPDGWEVDYGLNPLSGFHDSLVGWWPFDDGTGTSAVNSAMSGYDGELMNMSTSAWGQGVLGGALSFDGSDDYVRVLQSPAMLTGSEFTACGWVYLDPSYSADYPTLIADMGSCGSYYDGFWLGHDDDYVPAVAALLDDCTSPLTYPYATASITGAWVHLAVTVSGTSSILYLNGVEVASATGGFSPSEQSEVRIGWGNDPSYTYHWKGMIDDVRLYTSALSSNEIANLYDAFADPDGDGYTNLEEYQAGANPTVSNPPPQIVITYPVNGGTLP